MAHTEDEIDNLLDKLEASVQKIDSAQGSAVKISKAEFDALCLVEKARDAMTNCLHCKIDQGANRENLTTIFGGDCVRIARMHEYLEAIQSKISEKNSVDKRLSDCVNKCHAVEGILIQKGLNDALRAAQAGKPRQKPAPKPAPYVAPPAPPAPAPPKSSTKNVLTGAGGDYSGVDPDTPRVLTVTISSELNPTFDFAGGTMIMELEYIMVKIEVTCAPAWPTNVPPFPPSQEFWIPTTKSKEIFDPKNPGDMPGGIVQHVSAGQGEICGHIPDWMTVQVQRQTMAPWGSHKLMEGKKETELHYEVEVDSTVTMGEGETEDTSCLGIGLSVKFTGWLTGYKSAPFQADGQPREAPVRE